MCIRDSCPSCGHPESKVVDSRPSDEFNSIRRRRECLKCGNRFTTYERLGDNPCLLYTSSGFAMDLAHPVVCIVGPTASGKTDVAQAVAERIGAAVVSADSMQIYRGMDIGTGKIAASQRRVEHFGFDICDPGQPYSAALFQDYARSCFASLDRCV